MIDRKPNALRQFLGASQVDGQVLDKVKVNPDTQAEAFRQRLGTRFADKINSGQEVTFELVGKQVKVLAAFRPGDMVLLRSDLGRGDGEPYTVIATVGPKTSFDHGSVELFIGGKVGVDAIGRKGILISEKADPTKTTFSLEVAKDTLAGASQLPPTESTGAIHTGSGKVMPNARHTWGVILEAGDPASSIVQSISSASESEKAGIPDSLEETGDKPRQIIKNASWDTKNTTAPIPVATESIIIKETDTPVKNQDLIWTLVLRKQFMDEAQLQNGVIQPLRGSDGAQDNLVDLAITNTDEKRLVETRNRRMEVMLG